MRTIHIITGLLLAGSIVAGCTRENEHIPPAPYPEGGRGGLATLNVTPRHHLQNIANARVYIKYNSKQEPAVYDDSMDVEMVNGKPVASFTLMKEGDYYLFARGENPNIEDTIQTVSGGAYFIIPDTLEVAYDIYLDVFDHKGK